MVEYSKPGAGAAPDLSAMAALLQAFHGDDLGEVEAFKTAAAAKPAPGKASPAKQVADQAGLQKPGQPVPQRPSWAIRPSALAVKTLNTIQE